MTTDMGCPPNTQHSQGGSFRPFFEAWDIENFLEGNCDRQSSPIANIDIDVTNSLDLTIYSTDVSDYTCLKVSEVKEYSGEVSARSTVDGLSDLIRCRS